jgi:signal transduction histidine kinase/ligand-binding sensor domain-containing protein/DNA-binding response OmpR family regulator
MSSCKMRILPIMLAVLFFTAHKGIAQSHIIKFQNYSIEEGLSNPYIQCIYQDKRGYLWIGTSDGLNRFDGYTFKIYRYSESDTNSLNGVLVRAIYEDSDGNLWIGTERGGLCMYRYKFDNFKRFTDKTYNNFTLTGKQVNSIVEDSRNRLWLGTNEGLYCFHYESGSLNKYSHNSYDSSSLINDAVNIVFIDDDSLLWVGTNNGLDYMDRDRKGFVHFQFSKDNQSDSRYNQVMSVCQDSYGNLWVGTYLGGLKKIDRTNRSFKNYILEEEGLRSQTIRAILEDKNDNLLIGTRGGLYIFNIKSGRAELIEHDDYNPFSLSHNSVWSIFKDKKGDIWVGTRNGVSYLNQNIQVFKHYKAASDDIRFLNNPEIWEFMEDSRGNIWIGTEAGGVNIFDRRKGEFIYLFDYGHFRSFKEKNVKALMEDKDGRIWIGTFMGGIILYDKNKEKIKVFRNDVNDPASLCDDRVWDIFQDSKNRIWVGTENGLDRYDPVKETFIHYRDSFKTNTVNRIDEDRYNNLWFASENLPLTKYDSKTKSIKKYDYFTRIVYHDKKGYYWLGVRGKGLYKLDSDFTLIRIYNTEDGLPNNTIYGILEDNDNYIWISSLNGLSKFDPGNEEFINYFKQDGLQNNKFNYEAFLKTRQGELVFGGINGFNIFNPSDVRLNTFEPSVVFTDFKIFNKSVNIDQEYDDYVLLSSHVNETERITIPYSISVFTIEYSALNFESPSDNQYAYMLKGFENSWNLVGKQKSATYTNLDPGEYVFYVKAANNDDIWNENPRELYITILPPYWKTLWFKLFLVFLIGASIYLIIVILTNRAKLKNQIVFERMQAQRMHELDMMKFKLFTNISHEIRTPLSLITSPLEHLLKSERVSEETKDHLKIMHRNARRLMSLVNQLMEYRKLEAGKLKLELTQGDLVKFIKDIINSFTELAEERDIKLELKTVVNEILIWFDPDKLEMVIYNLLSNAFKFTPDKGKISVLISLIYRKIDKSIKEAVSDKVVEISISDTGIGISQDQIDKVFERFYQSEKSQFIRSGGSGIGLALSKDIIELHNGSISATSKEGKGTTFRVYLPYERKDLSGQPKEQSTEAIKVPEINDEANFTPEELLVAKDKLSENNLPILLIIEDNHDMVYFVKKFFEKVYNIFEAYDGEKGLLMAQEIIPDIIICDILLPKLDGRKVCAQLKNDVRTSHIPIILLTALSSKEHEKDGFLVGADAYISKPFDPDILKVRLEQMLKTQQKLKEKYSHQIFLEPKDIEITSSEEKFIKKAIKIVEDNLHDPDFGVNEFSREIGISKVQLYRKFRAISDMTVKEFIRTLRIKRAAQLISKTDLTVSEVAYKVGFREVNYFRKCFKEFYNVNPSEYS